MAIPSHYFKPAEELGFSRESSWFWVKPKPASESSSDIVKQVWNNVDHQSITNEEIRFLEEADQFLGGVTFTREQALTVHEYVKDPERRELKLRVIFAVQKLRKKNIEKLKKGRDPIGLLDPECQEIRDLKKKLLKSYLRLG